MQRYRTSGPIIRAASIFSIIAALITGITYAILQTAPVSINGNTISSASAGLMVGTSGSTLNNSGMVGFNFSNLEPGAPASPANDHTFYLENSGTAPLNLRVAIGPGMRWSPLLDISHVWLQITNPDGSLQKISLATLNDSYSSGFSDLKSSLTFQQLGQYKVQALIDTAALPNGDVSNVLNVNSMDLVFEGVSPNAS